MRTGARAEMRARTTLARSELEQIGVSRSELKLFQLVLPDWSFEGERSMDVKYWLAQSYSTQSKQFIGC